MRVVRQIAKGWKWGIAFLLPAVMTIVTVAGCSSAGDANPGSGKSSRTQPESSEKKTPKSDDSPTLHADSPSPSQPATPKRQVAKKPVSPVPAHSDQPIGRDLFAQCRVASNKDGGQRYWQEVSQAIRHLKTIDGASVDPKTGRLVLSGDYTEVEGPFYLEDLVTALWNEFHGTKTIGMTIDPVEGDKRGPLMDVKFLGGTEDTHIGQVMFECDRLMKCLSLGQDNLSKKPLTSKVENFLTFPTLALHLQSAKDRTWARFWLVPALSKFADEDSRGKPVATMTEDRNTIWIKHAPVYVQTEDMREASQGGKLVGTGKQNKAAKRFADHFSVHYDDFAKEHQAFGDLKELSKLLVVAQWIRQWQVPIDYELLYLDVPSGAKTPKQTPTLNVKEQAEVQGKLQGVQVFGGVDFRPRTFFAKDTTNDTQDFAASLSQVVQNAKETEAAIRFESEGRAKQAVLIGNEIRGPPAKSELRKRTPVGLTESSGELKPTSRRGTFLRQQATESATRERPELPAFVDPVTQREILNLPVLRVGYSPRVIHKGILTLGSQKYEVRIPNYLYVTSPLRDVNLQFQLKPDIDVVKNEPFFPSTTEGVKGFYPKSDSVVFQDGTTIRFDSPSGMVAALTGGGKPSLEFSHRTYEDGPLVKPSTENPNLLARPPPPKSKRGHFILRESRGDVVPSSIPTRKVELNRKELQPSILDIKNTETRKTLSVHQHRKKIIFVE